MKQLQKIRKNLSLFLLSGILMLCFGFVLINCGMGPQGKVLDPVAGQFAIDFAECTGVNPCRVIVETEIFKNTLSKKIGGKEITIEAWLKSHSTSTAGIFGRMDSEGAALILSNKGTAGFVPVTPANAAGMRVSPRFIIRRAVIAATPSGTSTVEYIVDSNVNISDVIDQWIHIAGVVANQDHTSTHAACSGADAGAEASTPHMDIYVNGVFRNCAPTFRPLPYTTLSGHVDPTAPSAAFAGEPGGNSLYVGMLYGIEGFADGVDSDQLDGAVDEPRLWGSARTRDQINQCMNQELGFSAGTCGRKSTDLIGYFRFNEGKGNIVNEWSGLGSAAKEYTNPNPTPDKPAIDWFTGWTSDTPNLTSAD